MNKLEAAELLAIAGLTSAAGMLLGTGLIMNWLIRHNHASVATNRTTMVLLFVQTISHIGMMCALGGQLAGGLYE